MRRIETGPLYEDLELSPPQRAFLAVFIQMGSIIDAARACKMGRRTHTWWMHDAKNAAVYRTAYKRAETDATAVMEAEAFKRAMKGEREGVWYKGRLVGHQIRKSDKLLEVLLKAHNPDKYADRNKTEISGALSIQEIDDQVRKARELRDAELVAD